MSSTMHNFYLTRADACRADAAAATLANVRDRFLTSETTWRRLADRAGRVEALHVKLVAEKSAARAAAAALVA